MRPLLLGAALLAGLSARGLQHITGTTDFARGLNTNGWTTTGSTWRSPVYPAPVESFSLSGTNLSEGASFSVACSGGAFSVSALGTARLTTFTASYTLTRLETPQSLLITNVVDGSLRVVWSAVADATGYRIELCTNRLEGAAAGTPLFAEAFSRVPGKGSSTALDADTFGSITDTRADWSFDTCFYGTLPNTNVVQIGNSSTAGFLSLRTPTGLAHREGLTLEFAARRCGATTAPDMPVTRVTAAGETNLLGVVTLADAVANYHLALPSLANDDTLHFHSATNKKDGRVLLAGVRILDGYRAGTIVHAPLETITNSATFCDFKNLPAATVAVRVSALAATCTDDSEPSDYATVDLADPPYMPVLRAYPLSRCVDDAYAEDFGALSNITAKTTWYNGIWPVPYWMGYNDQGEVLSTIGLATTNTTTSGFFAFTSATREHTHALGFRGTASRDFHYGIAFLNDTGAPRSNFTLSYEGVQWNHKNVNVQTNTFEYLITNELVGVAAPGDWVSVPALDFAPPCTTTAFADADEWWGGVQSATLSATLGADQYLIVRWTDARSSSSGGVGVAHVRLTSARVPRTSCLIIR